MKEIIWKKDNNLYSVIFGVPSPCVPAHIPLMRATKFRKDLTDKRLAGKYAGDSADRSVDYSMNYSVDYSVTFFRPPAHAVSDPCRIFDRRQYTNISDRKNAVRIA